MKLFASSYCGRPFDPVTLKALVCVGVGALSGEGELIDVSESVGVISLVLVLGVR